MERERVRMYPIVWGWNQRNWYKFMVLYIQVVGYGNRSRYRCICVLMCLKTYFLALSFERD